MKFSWTPNARATYFSVIAYLEKAWTKKEIQNFVDETEIHNTVTKLILPF
jgi:hypothetical protein